MDNEYKVLLFDDLPQARASLKEKLEAEGMIVFTCRNVFDVRDVWEDEGTNLKAIVLDVMMPSAGLGEDLRPIAMDGLLTGWVWLWHFLKPNNDEPHPAVGKCIILFSAYLDNFDLYMSKPQRSDVEKEFADCVERIPKGSDEKEDAVVARLLRDRDERAVLGE